MANQIFMRVDEVAEELGVSVPYAYKLIRQMNEELAKTGCITISGRIDRKFFHEKFYGTRTETTRKGEYRYAHLFPTRQVEMADKLDSLKNEKGV